MKSFSSVSAVAFALSVSRTVLAQQATDGMLPLTTIALTNQAGSTTGSSTIFATAISTATVAGGGFTTIYSDLSGIVVQTPVSESTVGVESSAVVTITGTPTSLGAETTTVTSAGSGTTSTGVVVISKASSSASGSASEATSASGTASKAASASASNTKGSTSSSSSSSSSASASASKAAGERVVAGGLGVVGAMVAGLFVM